jgi:L-methionine (R)-S-oxide reductase
VPIRKDHKIIGVIDIDSEKLGTFDDTDARYLELLAELL